MPTIGLDCHLILDASGYWIDPESYHMIRPRVRSAQHNRTATSGSASAGERYVDFGPGKREWTFICVASGPIRDYAGSVVATTGQTFHDSLTTSYQKVNTTLSFTDPGGTVYTVRFDDLAEHLTDVREQADSRLQWLLAVRLVEA